ncbi:MAG: tetratricopeptide repeat protein [Bradymonadales bacterium]
MSSNEHDVLGLPGSGIEGADEMHDEIEAAMGIFGVPDNADELEFDSAFDALLSEPAKSDVEGVDADASDVGGERVEAEESVLEQGDDSRVLGANVGRSGDRFAAHRGTGRFPAAVPPRAPVAGPRIYGAGSGVVPSVAAPPAPPMRGASRAPVVAPPMRGVGRGRVMPPKPREDFEAKLDASAEVEELAKRALDEAGQVLSESTMGGELRRDASDVQELRHDMAEDSTLGFIEVESSVEEDSAVQSSEDEFGDAAVDELAGDSAVEAIEPDGVLSATADPVAVEALDDSVDSSDVSAALDDSVDSSDVSAALDDSVDSSDVLAAVAVEDDSSEQAAQSQESGALAKPELDLQQKPVILPIPEQLAGHKYLSEHAEYRSESRRLLRSQDWRALAEMMDNSLNFASWASLPEVRSSMLKDLARLYGEQLGNPQREEETYAKLLLEDATDREALQYMVERLEEREDYEKIHALYRRAVDNTWDHAERVRYTQDAVEIAAEQMHKPALVIEDWEHLWAMGEHGDEVEANLLASYRRYGHWRALAKFIEARCREWGNLERLGWREIVEIYISGLKSAEEAHGPLESLLKERPLDPLLLLQSVNVSRLSGDIDKLAQLSRISGLSANVSHDILRATADVLWEQGERELSVQAYDVLLLSLPDDRDALQAKENYFLESGNYEALCVFYEGRADKALDEEAVDEVRANLEKAAKVAEEWLNDTERAIALWKRIIHEHPEDASAYEKIIKLYESIDDVHGVSQSLEGLLGISYRPAVRKELLARLGTLYFDRLEQYEKAEECWLKVMAIDPMNPMVSEELSRIYAKRGDYGALDKSLMQQIRTARPEDVLSLTINKAKYLEEDSPLSGRSAASWEMVLDYSPHERNALESLAKCAQALERPHVMMGALEQAFVDEHDLDERIALGLRIAKAREEHASYVSTLAAYLRVLRLEPCNSVALEAMEKLCAKKERGLLAAVLEHAVCFEVDVSNKVLLLKRVLQAVDEDEISKRISILRRLIGLGDKDSFAALASLVQENDQYEELAASYMRAAYEASYDEETLSAIKSWAKINEEKLDDASSAFMLVLSAGLETEKLENLLGELDRLAQKTARWEDMLAVLGRLSVPSFSESQRRYVIERRLEILLKHINSPRRAMEEYRRLLVLQPYDLEVLHSAEALAQENDLYDELLALYDELWDKTQSLGQRLEISAKRYQLYKETLKSKEAAFYELILSYRLHPSAEISEQLKREAELLGRHDLSAALLESEARAAMQPDAESLSAVAEIYEELLVDPLAATSLYASAFSLQPANSEYFEKLKSFAADTQHKERHAHIVRSAASLALEQEDEETAVSLYRYVAEYYVEQLQDKERSIDIQRRIMRIDPHNIAASEALIEWHEQRNEWSELRSEIKHRISAGGDEETICDYWMRVAVLSRDHLNDLEGAFEAYAQILTIQEDNEEARVGVSELTGSEIGPEVTARRLKLELRLASEEDRPRIMLNLAKLQDEELKQTDAACETLESLYAETGPLGIGFKPLSALYERQKEWSSLAKIYKENAEAQELEGEYEKAVANLQKALKLADTQLHDDAFTESLVRKLYEINPQSLEMFERYNTILLKSQQWSELSTLLASAKNIDGVAPYLKGYNFELARIKWLALNSEDEALAIYKNLTRPGKVERNAFLGMASIYLKQGKVDDYISVMEQVAKLIDPVWGAILYCHLAEVCDENDKANQVANYYRSARGLDANNANASEGLRSIGRRLKNWRQASALLPDEDERELGVITRSERLCALAKKAKKNEEARTWLWKAIAVNHDNIVAWEELAKIEAALGNTREQYESQFGALGAFERSNAPSEANAIKKAYHLQNVALAAQEIGLHDRVESLYRQAFAIAPDYAPVAVAVGNLKHESGDLKNAFKIYDRILKSEDASLDQNTRIEMHLKRGLLANAEKNYELALDDLRQTVKAKPLHIEALLGLAETYLQMQQPLLSLYHLQQALIVTPDKTDTRGEILYTMGKVWSDSLEDPKEAGIYYEAALDNGATQADLIERCLEIYRQVGRYAEALELVDKLTQTTSDPKILASLWCTRGELTEQISPDQATEAFDMALSYSPGIAKALDGLERMLAARSEWSQLADLLEGRLEGEADESQQASIMLRLADLYTEKLDKADKARQLLERVLESHPSAEVIERLLKATPQEQHDERINLLKKGITYCEERYQKAIEIALYLHDKDKKLQAWAILSPLRALLNVDAQLKDILNNLKTEFEKPETLLYEKLQEVLPKFSDEQFAIVDAINLVREKLGSFGANNLDEVTQGAAEVTEFTPNGKLFHQMKAALGLENIQLWRSADLPQAIVVIDADPTIVCIKTEIFQKASGNEIQFWLAKALLYAHPDYRSSSAAPAQTRELLAEAILAVAGIIESYPEIEAIVKQLSQNLEDSSIEDLRSSLTLYEQDALHECAKTFWKDAELVSDIAGSLTVAELRTVWRAQSRIDESIPEQRSAKSIEDLDAIFQNSETLSEVLAFYVGEKFGDLLT